MKKYISEAAWKELEHMLMECQIPYRVDFNSKATDDGAKLIYTKCITIEPVYIEYEKDF